jgi:hypothetical protein
MNLKSFFYFVALVRILAFQSSNASEQKFDEFTYQGKSFSTSGKIFEASFITRSRIEFTCQTSDNWKGFECRWAVDNDKLMLVDFRGWIDRREVRLKDIWKGEKTPCPASWYSGVVVIFPGLHGTGSIGKRFTDAISLTIVDGVIVRTDPLETHVVSLDEDRGGVGLELTIHTESGEVVVSKVIDGSPVSKTRLVSQGDKLLSIDLLGQSFEVSNSLSRAIGLLRGKPGTKVSFEMVNQNGERSKITLKRELLVRKDESNGRPTRH